MAGRMQVRANRLITVIGALVGAAIGILPFAFPFFDFVYYQAGDPPVVVPLTIWPLDAVKLAVGVLFGPWAGAAAGLLSQSVSLVRAGNDLATVWPWVVIGGTTGFLAGWVPRRLPSSWQSSGTRRFAGAAAVGAISTVVGCLPILLDALVRPGVSWALAVGEYVAVIAMTSVVAAIMLPLLLALAIRLRVHPAIPAPAPSVTARPGWRPFAVLLTLGVAVLLVPLYVQPEIRLIGPTGGSAGPGAAPAPAGGGGVAIRSASVSLGNPLKRDRSCDAEGKVRSPYVWALVNVTLYNKTAFPLGVTWLDYEGHREGITPIDEDGPGYGEWGAGHLFMLTGPDDGCLMIFKIQGTTPLEINLRS